MSTEYFESNGPLSRDLSALGWTSGMTSPIDIVNQDDFRDFLESQGVTYQELSGLFLLYRSNLQRWPNSTDVSVAFKDDFAVLLNQMDGLDSDPFSFFEKGISLHGPGYLL